MCHPVFLKRRHDIPPFPKAATEVGINMRRDMKHQSWAMNSDKELVFKIRALHCTPLEFRAGFLTGGF